MNVKEELTRALNQAGVSPNEYSIDDPKENVLNFQSEPFGYSVWFQNLTSRYDVKTYDNLGEAVYEFCTRLMPTEEADQIAKQFHDPDLKVYPH